MAAAMVERLSELPVIPTDATLVRAAIDGSRIWNISLWDALIVCAAEASGCRTLLTEDLSDGEAYGSVRVTNPFIPPAADAGEGLRID